ncbi:MAG: HTTM domain-containing protein [Bacteroidota bacterium]
MEILFKKRDIKQLAILRIIIGSWFFIDIVSMLVSGYVKEAYVTPEMNFAFYGFDWIKPLSGNGMYWLFGILAILTIGIITGYQYRLSLILFLGGFSYVFMCDIVYTLNKFYLFLILGFVLLFTNAHRGLSFIKKSQKSTTTDNWQILIFQILFGLIYTLSGVSKLNPDWLIYAEPLMLFYKNRIPFKWLPPDIYTVLVYIFSYCGMLFDLSIIWLLSFKRTNFIANLLQTSFHLLNFLILSIGSLSIFSIMITWLLFPTPWLKRKLKISTATSPAEPAALSKKKWIAAGLAFFMFLNIIIPLRHFIVGTEVNWTEKGHRFSWRLMTRAKGGSIANFTVVDNQSGNEIAINPRKLLTRRQYRKMAAETDLVLCFAHFLRDKYTLEFGHSDVSVYSKVMTKLNGRQRNLLIDPTLDLSKVSRSFLVDRVSNPQQPRKQSPNK